MSVATVESNVGRKGAKRAVGDTESRRYGTLVRVSDEVAQIARELAPMKGVSMAELLTDTLKPILEKMRDEEMRKRLGKK